MFSKMGSWKVLLNRASACVRPEEEISAKDFHDKYLLGPKLGRGAFAEVYVTKKLHHDNASTSHGKAVKISSSNTQKQKTALFLEEEIWLAIGHQNNCVQLYEVFHGESLSYMVMERCTCSLYHYIKKLPDVTERTLGPILSQMLQSLHQVHSAWVAHRDVKPDNFLIGGEDARTVKLCDFGLSAILRRRGNQLSDIVGTPPFMCPEMLSGKGYSFKADVWSVGVVAYTFLFGVFPYMPKTKSSRLMKNAIIEGVPPTFRPVGRRTTSETRFRSDTVVDFVRGLLSREPQKRPSAVDALNMEYMTSIMGNCHATSIDLPSLEQVISSAKEIGVFENQDLHKEFDIDVLLNDLQMERHQVPLFKRRPCGHSSMAPALTTACANDSNGICSENVSMATTMCPSDVASRMQSKTSVGSRLSSKSYFGSRLASKASIESRLFSKTSVESRFSSKQSVENSIPTNTAKRDP